MGAPERAEVVRLRGRGAVGAVVQQAHQVGYAERAAHQHHFVVTGVGVLAERRDDPHRLLEFTLGELRVAHEAVQVAHEVLEDLLRARVRRAAHLVEDCSGNVFLGFDDHGYFSRSGK